MSVMVKPLIATFEATAAIAKGKGVILAVSQGGKKVTQASSTTDKVIGIAQNAAVNAGDLVEVAFPGGGAKGLAQATIAAGDILGVNASGSVQKLANASDRIVGYAMDDAVASDVFQMFVAVAQGVATQA